MSIGCYFSLMLQQTPAFPSPPVDPTAAPLLVVPISVSNLNNIVIFLSLLFMNMRPGLYFVFIEWCGD